MPPIVAAGVAFLLTWAPQSPSPADAAYAALRQKDYERAIALFLDAIAAAPNQPSLRKDIAYTYLKAGETEAARDQFAESMRLDPSDEHVALEYAFLCYETKREGEARRIFDRLRKTGQPASRATAAQAFENIDRPLQQGIARWSAVAAASPDNFSAHQELARLAERRDMLDLAAGHYLAAWRIKPAERSLLIDLGRVWKNLGKADDAMAALLTASRGASPRVVEEARELLPARYPFVPEFRAALALDPANANLRRELAYLLLEMKRNQEAEEEFRALAADDLTAAAQLGFLLLARGERDAAMPLLERVLKSDNDELAARVRAALKLPPDLRRRSANPSQVLPEPGRQASAREMGERSYRAGYLKDALKYFQAAHEADPVDFSVLLKLGWTLNLLGEDEAAARWFNLARRSPDPGTAAEAEKAWKNLRAATGRFRTSVWMMPFYSSRWNDLFSYGQARTEIRVRALPVRPYVSVRFIGDTRRTLGGALPQYLSESAFILGAGVTTRPWRGAVAWFEAGRAVGYLARKDQPRVTPDYRGGVSFSRTAGARIGGEAPGWFAESADDAVFVSRFNNDLLFYSQNKGGYTLAPLAGFRAQVYANVNVTADIRREYWANSVEVGPGLRLRAPGLPKGLEFSINLLRGAYTRNEGNPRGPNFFDARAGFWYAFSR